MAGLSVKAATEVLVVTVTPGPDGQRHVATALAIPIPSDLPEGFSEDKVRHVFDNHAHDIIGVFASTRAAVDAAERYARAWLRKQPRADKCACTSIGGVSQ